jgi:hypothetical protein
MATTYLRRQTRVRFVWVLRLAVPDLLHLGVARPSRSKAQPLVRLNKFFEDVLLEPKVVPDFLEVLREDPDARLLGPVRATLRDWRVAENAEGTMRGSEYSGR